MKEKAIDNILLGRYSAFETIGMYLYPYPYLVSNPFYDNLRDEHRFQEIVELEKEKYEEKLRKYGEF